MLHFLRGVVRSALSDPTSRYGASLLVVGLSLFSARDGHAFCRTTTAQVPPSFSPSDCYEEGLPIFWKSACVSYSVNARASAIVPLDEAMRVIDTSFTTWNNVICADTNERVGIQAVNLSSAPGTEPASAGIACDRVQYNKNGANQNVVVFRDDAWPYSDPNHTLGLTTVTFNAETGEIFDVDMEINAADKNITTTATVARDAFDLESVVTHEAGHFFGLAHATDTRASMFASYKPGSSSTRTLFSDDAAGLCAIYPDATTRVVATSVSPNGTVAASGCDATPRRGFSATCDANPEPEESSNDGGCSVVGRPGATVASLVPTLGIVALFGVARRAMRRRESAR